jgi:hypothetical protein
MSARSARANTPVEIREDIVERLSSLCLALPEVTVRIDGSLTRARSAAHSFDIRRKSFCLLVAREDPAGKPVPVLVLRARQDERDAPVPVGCHVFPVPVESSRAHGTFAGQRSRASTRHWQPAYPDLGRQRGIPPARAGTACTQDGDALGSQARAAQRCRGRGHRTPGTRCCSRSHGRLPPSTRTSTVSRSPATRYATRHRYDNNASHRGLEPAKQAPSKSRAIQQDGTAWTSVHGEKPT